MSQKFSEVERRFVRENVERIKDEQIAETLTRICGRLVTVSQIRGLRHEMGLRKQRGRGICRLEDK